MAYATIDIEGGFFPSDLIERIGEGDTDIEGQRAADFRLPRNRSLTEEIQRAFSDSRVYWDAFNRRLNRSQESRTTLTRQDWAAKFFELLGFPPLKYQRAAVEAGGSQFIISHRVGGGENAVPIHIVTLDQGLDDRGTRNRRSPHTQVQDFLNRSEALWGVTTNGTHLRLLRDSARLSKPTYLEFDLRAMIDGNDYREFVVLYRLMHSTRFPLGEIEPHECLLENYYNQGIEEGGRVREKLRHGVKSALEVLGRALVSHPGNGTLRRALRGGTLDETGYYRQLLNFVYRMLFLMVAEERKLLFIEPSTGQTIYDRYYSVTRLRERAEHYFAGDNHGDLWAGLAETFRLCRDEAAARHLNLSPLNGELFGEQACSRIETAHCSNETLLTVMRSLSTFHDGGVRRRVNYAALDVEEFGSVYESLLDYRPVLDVGEVSGSPPSFDLAAGTQRKETGSYYTPPELVRELVDSALVPVMEERLAAADTRIKKVQALLDLRVCDPASGSGHFLLAAARRIARELAKIRAGGEEPSPLDYRRALRTVVRHCIYAVDKNPLAVDLCKVALWIECHTVGLPLGFLDHHVKCGDSLVGVMDLDVLKEGIPDAAYKPVTGDDKEAAKWYRKRNKKERTGQQRLTSEPPPLDTQKMADDFANFGRRAERSAADVKKMEKEYRELQNSEVLRRFKVACDLWTYAFFAPRESFETEEHDRVPTTDDIRRARNGQNTGSQLEDRAHQASRDYPYFHWPLEFPDVCFKDGGFDVVLGNPPWDQVQLDPREFFATSDPDVANQPNMAARNRAIQRLASTNPGLYLEYQVAVREMKATQKFIHSSGRFPKTSYGRLNYAPLFAEHSKDLQHPRGKAGIIVPTGIATDSFNQYFFADLIDHRALVSLYDFENKRKVFPGIDGRLKFCLLTLSGIDRPSAQGEFAFFLHHTEQLQDSERRFFLSSEDFALFNPNTRTCPLFRTQKDMEIARKMYQYAGVFWRELSDDQPESNPWGVKFQLMFMMNTASYLFRTHQQLTEDGWELRGNIFIRGEELYLPLYEAKLFHQYDHRFATFAESSPKDLLKGNAQTIPSNEKANPHTLPLPRYWVPENEVMTKLNKAVTGHTTTIGSDRIGSDRIGSDRIGSDRIGSDRIGSDRIGSDRIGSDRIGSGTGDRRYKSSPDWRSSQYQAYRQFNESPNRNSSNDPSLRHRRIGNNHYNWLIAFRDITNATNQRTTIVATLGGTAVSNKAPLLHIDSERWLQAYRNITNATNERTTLVENIPLSAVGHSSSLIYYKQAKVVASTLVLANMNSLPLDWAARLSVGGTNLNFFIIKQLPILPPETYLEEACLGLKYVELIVPRVLELTYTAHDLEPFARDLGYEGPPFIWDDERRHKLKSELDAIYAHMYRLEREDLEWILDAPPPSASFPTLKRKEMKEFGEYRTQRYVLAAYDQMARGELPDLSNE